MFYSKINYYDIANGPGVRVSLFVSGCRNHCKGCFNESTWNFFAGKPFTVSEVCDILDHCGNSYIKGLSLLGGDPFEPENQKGLLPLAKAFKTRYPDKTIWCYTGYLFENLKDKELMKYIDVLVDGPFVEELKNITLQFRGSENQRIINVPCSLIQNKIVLIEDDRRGI